MRRWKDIRGYTCAGADEKACGAIIAEDRRNGAVYVTLCERADTAAFDQGSYRYYRCPEHLPEFYDDLTWEAMGLQERLESLYHACEEDNAHRVAGLLSGVTILMAEAVQLLDKRGAVSG